MPPSLPPNIRIHHDVTTSRSSGGNHRSLLATTTFQPGDRIATFSDPLLALPDGATMRSACNYCLRPASPSPSALASASQKQEQQKQQQKELKACTACKAAVYCNPVCQRAHWKAGHRGECAMFKRVKESAGQDWIPTPVRAVALVLMATAAAGSEKGEGKGKEKDEERARRFREAFGFDEKGEGLEGNVEGFKRDAEGWRDVEMMGTAAVVYSGLKPEEEVVEKAKEVLCMIQTNAFNRLDPDTGTAGIFLDAGLAMVNHSCVPNAFIGFEKRAAVLRAERPIQEGEEITISYIVPDTALPKAARYEALRQYHFQCHCPRCTDDLDVYQVCQTSPPAVIRLNTFSLQTDLTKLRHPAIDTPRKVSQSEIETIHKQWLALPPAASDDEKDHLKLAQARWALCQPLIQAKMWAIEPLPTTILELATRWQTSYHMVVYALPLMCFLALECDPIKLVAPFLRWRVKGVLAIVKLLMVTGEFTASGELANRCTHEGILGTLAMADQVSMCEALLRLVVYQGGVGASEEWEVMREARELLADLETLRGREQESRLVRLWARDWEDVEGGAFVEEMVLRPVRTLAGFAVEGLEAMVGGKSLEG
ncbi:uncharacterized protein C8A04DRAFT_14984 [Dichotomopilus funicola]|uniref:Suppressor of anucleate metulae protein B n=1 Tax=Dichotomopilus funicola TaxID=1934379 RepID=A0AAN6UWC6_9PEZI|nr:hypothetical protein C8A04DRAFT_14984 [Dichotomopilus funicola]